MKRTGPIKPKRKKPKRANPLKAGATGRALCRKGPWKSREHLDRVKAHPCLLRWSGYCGWCEGPTDPHHCRKLVLGRLLPRHDSLTIPLCRKHHKAMDGDERKLWRYLQIDSAVWIANFSPEGRAAIEALRERKI